MLLALTCFAILSSCTSEYIPEGDQVTPGYYMVCFISPDAPVIATIGKFVNPFSNDSGLPETPYVLKMENEHKSFPFYVLPNTNGRRLKLLSNAEKLDGAYKLHWLTSDSVVLTAQTEIPSSTIQSNSVIVELFNPNFSESGIRQSIDVRISWNDESDTDNYYHLIPYKVNYRFDVTSGKFVINTENPKEALEMSFIDNHQNNQLLLQHEPGALIAEDNSNAGQLSYRFRLRTNGIIDLKKEIFKHIQFELRKVTKDYYLFHRSVALQLANNNQRIPLYEPILTHTNVSGGYGIFAGYRSIFQDKLFQ